MYMRNIVYQEVRKAYGLDRFDFLNYHTLHIILNIFQLKLNLKLRQSISSLKGGACAVGGWVEGQLQSTTPVCSLICSNNCITLALFKNLSRQP